RQLSDSLLGKVVTQFRQFDRLIGIRIRFSDEDRFNYDLIRQFPLLNPKTGTVIPLASIATLTEVNGQNEMWRENQRQLIAITARISGTSLGDVIPDVRKILQKTTLP